MYNPIRYHRGGRIFFDSRVDKPSTLSLLETSNIEEIKDYTHSPVDIPNTSLVYDLTENNYVVNTDLFGESLFNRKCLHSTSSLFSFSDDPTKNFTFARANSFVDINLLINTDLTYDFRMSYY